MDNRMEMIEKFKQYLERRAPGRRTSKDYVSDVKQFASQNDKEWSEIKMHDIDEFVDQQHQKGLSRATVKRRVAALRVFFDFIAEEEDDLSRANPVRFKRHAGKQAQPLPRDLSNEQVTHLWFQINSVRDRAWFALMLRAGLRVGEVVALTIQHQIEPPQSEQPARLRVWGKGQKERVVLLSQDAYEVVAQWLQERASVEHDYLFINHRNQPLQANGIEWLLKQYGQKAGVEVTPHQLRHTYARQLTEGGIPLPSLSKLMGHAQISTTQIYTVGADPQLSQAYQTVMTALEKQTEPDIVLQPTILPPARAEVVLVEPTPPDWVAWCPELPEPIRQETIAFVQGRWPTWKVQRRRTWAIELLAAFRRFWSVQMSKRPISHSCHLQLTDLRAFQQELTTAGKANSTINRLLDNILALLRHLAEQDQPVDPALFRLRSLPRPNSLPRHLSDEDYLALAGFVRTRFDSPDPLVRLENATFFLLAHSGLRARECLDLLVQDLHLPAQRLWVRQGKGLKDRPAFLSNTAQLALTLYLDGHAPHPLQPLFLHPTGRHPLSKQWLYRHVVDLGLAAGHISVSPHRLRHTLATRLLNAGMDITHIQKILGHQHLTTTMIYARVLDKTLEQNYHQAMALIEHDQIPLSQTPQFVPDWPVPQQQEVLL